jgi:hypothetical protein
MIDPGVYVRVKAEMSEDYKLNNVFFYMNGWYISGVTKEFVSTSQRNLSLGAYTSYSGYKDDNYAFALYLPAYKSDYVVGKEVKGGLYLNDYTNREDVKAGLSYEMSCSVSSL